MNAHLHLHVLCGQNPGTTIVKDMMFLLPRLRSDCQCFSSTSAGAGDRLVHWLLGSHLLLVPRLSRGEQIQQGVCNLCRCLVVGHGESGAIKVRLKKWL